ncbi:MAG TPA: HemK/PrmC family methyltransferase [Patescibacteria group bacterium]|nr:HemK/PrmC family methyltransferase [Patescibacteria group bacterium]
MKVNDWLDQATNKLEKAGIGTARLDALVLLEDATGHDRAYLLAHPETPLRDLTLQRLDEMAGRRTEHEPLAYIRGKTEFYGHEFIINSHVLEPRPESETMIDMLKVYCSNKQNYKVVDVGTGSGALGITAQLEIPGIKVIGMDIDPQCLKLAKQNAAKHEVDIKLMQGNLLEPLKPLDPAIYALLCNLPYVPDGHTINQAAAMEPRIAIFGGPDGLDIYRELFEQINRGDARIHFVFTESLPFQHKELDKIAKIAGFKLIKADDFIQCFASLKEQPQE